MLRATLLLYFLPIFAQSAPIPYDLESDLAHVQDPDFLQITKEEKDLLIEMAQNHKITDTQDDILRALKEKSPTLYEKIVKIRTVIKERIEELDEDAQNFVWNCIAEMPNIMRARADGDQAGMMNRMNKIFREYSHLSEESRRDIEAKFSFLKSVGLSL